MSFSCSLYAEKLITKQILKKVIQLAIESDIFRASKSVLDVLQSKNWLMIKDTDRLKHLE